MSVTSEELKELLEPAVEALGYELADLELKIGGRDGPDPTRYGDWEKNGRCIDF